MLGPWAFLLFSGIALASGAFVAAFVPETKGRTLQEVQALLAGAGGGGGRRRPRDSELELKSSTGVGGLDAAGPEGGGAGGGAVDEAQALVPPGHLPSYAEAVLPRRGFGAIRWG